MKLIALQTIGVQTPDYRPAEAANPAFNKEAKPQRGKSEHLAPGTEFDTKEWDISDDEAHDLIQRKAARRKTKEVPDDKAAGEADGSKAKP